MIVVACLVAALAGAGVAAAVYNRELRRLARFLRERDAHSNQRATVEAPGRGLAELARAVNSGLDAMQAERANMQHRQADFQRDLASLSHDIRTPLTGAKGFLQLAQDELADENVSRETPAARYLKAADARLDDMNALLEQLFAYTRASDPDAQLNLQCVEIMPVIADVLVGHYPAFEQRGWEPHLRFEDEGITAQADADALARLFDNLVDNALRYGTTALEVRQSAQRIMFANGMEPSSAETVDTAQLFERFYRADTARSSRGTGLGLAVAAKLAESMGMQIEAHVENAVFEIALVLP